MYTCVSSCRVNKNCCFFHLFYVGDKGLGVEVLSVLLRNADLFRAIAVGDHDDDGDAEGVNPGVEGRQLTSPAGQPSFSEMVTAAAAAAAAGDDGNGGASTAKSKAGTDATALPTPRSVGTGAVAAGLQEVGAAGKKRRMRQHRATFFLCDEKRPHGI